MTKLDNSNRYFHSSPQPIISTIYPRKASLCINMINESKVKPGLPSDEQDRLIVLKNYEIMDTPPEDCFEDIVQAASKLCGTPMAAVSFVDEARQWFKALKGFRMHSTPRDLSLCSYVVQSGEVMEVPNCLLDERFSSNPYVTGEPGIRFYAGIPLIAGSKMGPRHVLGTLCVMDTIPRKLDPGQLSALKALSRLTIEQLNSRKQNLELTEALRKLKMSEDTNKEISDLNQSLQDFNEHLQVRNEELQERVSNLIGEDELIINTPAEEVVATLAELKNNILAFLEGVSKNTGVSSSPCSPSPSPSPRFTPRPVKHLSCPVLPIPPVSLASPTMPAISENHEIGSLACSVCAGTQAIKDIEHITNLITSHNLYTPDLPNLLDQNTSIDSDTKEFLMNQLGTVDNNVKGSPQLPSPHKIKITPAPVPLHLQRKHAQWQKFLNVQAGNAIPFPKVSFPKSPMHNHAHNGYIHPSASTPDFKIITPGLNVITPAIQVIPPIREENKINVNNDHTINSHLPTPTTPLNKSIPPPTKPRTFFLKQSNLQQSIDNPTQLNRSLENINSNNGNLAAKATPQNISAHPLSHLEPHSNMQRSSSFNAYSPPSNQKNQAEGSSQFFPHPKSNIDIEGSRQFYNNIDSWSFDIFKAGKKSNGHHLLYSSYFACEKLELIKRFQMDKAKLVSFLYLLEAGYLDSNTYHNSIHAADVLLGCFYFLTNSEILKNLEPLEKLAILFAAMVHDFRHLGVNNAFLITVGDELAIRSNDISVLENYHCAEAFTLTRRPECDFLSNMPHSDKARFRSMVIDMVLSTDMSRHLEILSQFQNRVTSGRFDLSQKEDRALLLRMTLKCADISNPTKPDNLYKNWVDRVLEEFYTQGDLEKSLGLPVSRFMDRSQPQPEKCQLGFISYIVLPTFKSWTQFLQCSEPLKYLEENLESWKRIEEKNNDNGGGQASM
eukprot:TRINITY_DN3337_c0_g1_i1.p1 TRINITY_DN3337_c0_g1~~TRINITY_DN3337_c0_g1_i1.p1  ORF type:complete len:950 (-),score=175.55 TRINITY_DN3337_c0_g1_i1:63-2912(-)